MLKRFLLFAMLFVALQANCQLNFNWVSCSDNNSTNAADIVLDSYNNIYTTNNASQSDSIAYVRKTDTNGNLIFQKNILSHGLYITGIDLDQNNNIYIGGYFNYESIFDSIAPYAIIGNGSMFIAKYDSLGAFNWVIEIGDGYDYILGLSVINNEINVVGRTGGTCDFDLGPGYSNASNTAFIAQYDFDANFISVNKIRKKYPQSDAIAYAITHDNDNNVIISGTYEKSVDLNFTSDTAYTLDSENGFFVAKYDSSLNFLWVKSSYTSGGSVPNITTDDQGNVIFNCYISAPANFDPLGLDAVIEGTYSYHVVGKYDPSGNFMWIKDVVVHEFIVDIGYGKDVCVDNVGNIYFTGLYNGALDFDLGIGGDISSISTDIFLAKYAADGSYMWVQSIGGNSGQTGLGVICDDNNSLYLTGTYYSSADFDLGPDSTSYIPQSNSSFLAKYGTELTGITENTQSCFTKIYPNPANDYFMVNMEKPCTISIINSVGQIVISQKLYTGLNRVDTSTLLNGLYCYSTFTAGQNYKNGKLLIVKQ